MSNTSRPEAPREVDRYFAGTPPEPVILEGRHVRLEPLAAAHLEALCLAGRDAATFQWYPYAVAGPDNMRRFIDSALAEQAQGRALPFSIRTRQDGALVGSSRFGAIDLANRRAEIGWTWLAPTVQRTPVNTECKRLMLQHGFQTLGFQRIEFKTDSLNVPSRTALLRIGATEEGTFRNHMIVTGGRARHSVYFSIIREEWPQIRERLDRFLAEPFTFAVPR